MFAPDDKKRTVVRRSLLDHVSKENDTPRRPAARPQTANGAGSLLDRLEELTSAEPFVDRQETRDAIWTKSEDVSSQSPRGSGGWSKRPADADARPPAYGAPESHSAYDERQDRPLIDLATILNAVWQLRMLIVVLTILGAVGGTLLAIATPSIYLAESKLYVDPREIRLTDSDLSKESLATEAILALVDSQLEVLRSRTVLEKVAVDMGLDRDPEFGGKAASAGGFSAGMDIIRNLISPAEVKPAPASGINPRTLEKLSDAVTVSRDPKTFIVTIQVQSRDPAKSALIANRIVATFLNEEQAAQSGFFQRTTTALDSRLSDLRTELDAAENAVEKYKAENDIVGASGQLISDKQLLALNDQVAAVRNRIADARSKADVATKTQLNDVLSGAFPEEVSSVTLQELRKQYSTARAQLGSLDASLGPRHPQRLAAAQSLDVARSEIGNELRRIEATAQTELDRAVRTEKDLLQQLAVLKAQKFNASGGFIELRELERKATATRTIYESFLKRASETGQEEKLTSKNIRVVSSAEPPVQAKGPSRKLIVIGCMLAGLMLGVGLGVALGAYRSLRDMLLRSNRTRETDEERDLPVHDDDPRGPGLSRYVEEPAPVSDIYRARMPSAHHAAASSAALSALPAKPDTEATAFHGYPREAEDDDRNGGGITQVQADLRALRARVETYAKLRTGTGR